MSKSLKLYTNLVILIGMAICAIGVFTLLENNIWFEFLFFTVLSVVAESLIIPLGEKSYLSIGFAIGLAAILIFNPYVAALIISLGTILKIYNEDGKTYHVLNSSFYKRLFNGSMYSISALMAGIAFSAVSSVVQEPSLMDFSIVGIVVLISVYVIVNIGIFVGLLCQLEGRPYGHVFREQIWYAKNFFAISPVGILMVYAFTTSGWFVVILSFGPLLLARYSFILYMNMKHMYFETIRTLSAALDAKDEYTNGHSHRVAEYSTAIAENMGMSPKQIETIKTAALLHDIGKIGIKDQVLNKPGKLDFKELFEVQQHPEIGANIIKEIAFLKECSDIVRYHHERHDGNGYPNSLRGDQIPIEAAIVAVADAFDAMTSDRSYRKAMSKVLAINIIKENAGTQFHPGVVEAFTRVQMTEEVVTEHVS